MSFPPPPANADASHGGTVSPPRILSVLSPPRRREVRRLLYLDWLRAQSVWNVLAGHAWGSAVDAGTTSDGIKAACTPTCGAAATETMRMIDYAVDLGFLHTIPMFFLVSGLLAGRSAVRKDPDAPGDLCRFVGRRVVRLVPPFLTGGVLYWLAHRAVGRRLSVLDVVLSHLWFLWALVLVQSVCHPFLIAARRLRHGGGWSAAAPHLAGWLAATAAFEVGAGVLFDVPSSPRVSWLFIVPAVGGASLLLTAAARRTEDGGASAVLVGGLALAAAACLAAALPLLAIAAPDPDQTEFEWLGPNLLYAVNVVIAAYLFGGLATILADDIAAGWTAGVPPGALPVSLLLLSLYLPVASTFWAERTLRRSLFLVTFTDDVQRGLASLRSLVWIGGQWWFAAAACDHVVHPWLYRHVAQSGVVLYVMHRAVEPLWLRVLTTRVDDGVALFVALLLLSNVSCFAIYAVALTHRFTRMACGIELVKLPDDGGAAAREELEDQEETHA